MKILIKRIAAFCLFLSVQSIAQDVVQTNLTANPILTNTWNALNEKNSLRVPSVLDTLTLDSISGILDDFSYTGPYPDTSIWLDNFVYINRTYPYSPPTLGVATFDGLNEKGTPYNFFVSDVSSQLADYLTSKPINLDFPPVDSIYFSFYFQPQGRGNSPDPKDSLVLEFKAPGSNTWNHIWSKPGTVLAFKDTLNWGLVLIPITNAAYLKKGFQFRFKNYATVSGSLDHWHIDYVYLNRYRKITDSSMDDVAYVYNQPSLIKTYQAMPWRQYTTAYSTTGITNLIRVNSSYAKNTSLLTELKDQNGTVMFTSPDNKNLEPFSQAGYFKQTASSLPVIPVMTGPTSYYSESNLRTTPDKERKNDTLRYEQKFGNYFAYDDGTAESAFGLPHLNAQLAVKFELNVTDTLRYVDIYFNPIITDASLYTFNLKVWADAGGVPGTELAMSNALTPRFTGGSINSIIRYGLGAPLILNPGVFYVGLMQNTNKPLNVGQDLNTNLQWSTFYNVGMGWNTMPYPGTPMLHPVFGRDSAVTVIPEVDDRLSAEIYPNPTTTHLTVRSTDLTSHKITYSIMDVFGKELENKIVITPVTLDISDLSKGIYFIRIRGDKISSTLKFIKIE